MSDPSSDDRRDDALADAPSRYDDPDDPWPDEPDEFDPESEGPGVDVPEPPDPTAADADLDPAVRRLFWKLVATFNLALFALALGPMFAFFRGQWRLGGTVFAIGAVTFVYGVWTYRRYRRGDLDGT